MPDQDAALSAPALRRIRVTGLLVLALVMVVLAQWESADGGPLATPTFDLYQRLLPRPVTDYPVTIVAIDDASLEVVGPWPWPRHVLAALQESAARQGAVAIGYDVMFSDADRYSRERLREIYAGVDATLDEALRQLPDLDAYFAASIASHPVVLGRVGSHALLEPGASPPALTQAASVEGPIEGLLNFPTALTNIQDLESYASGHGLLNADPDPDGRIRRNILLARTGEQIMVGLPLEMLRVARDAFELRIDGSGAAVELADRRIPLGPNGTLRPWFSYTSPERYVSAVDLLGASPPQLHGQIVLVGAAAVGMGDAATTALDTSFGVEIHAQVIEVLLDGAWLLRPAALPIIEWLLLLLLSSAAVIWVPRWNLFAGITLIVLSLVALAAAGTSLFLHWQLLFDPSLPALGLFACSIPLYSTMWLEASRQSARAEAGRRQAAEELNEARIAHARLDGELTVARDIQQDMLPRVDAIAGLPVSIRVSASLEPANEIGGDLYEFFMLNPKELFFMLGDVTGKGVPAALYMAISKTLIASAVRHAPDALNQAIGQANRQLCREADSAQFLTLVAGVLNCETGVLQIVNAGHQDPILIGGPDGPRPLVCHGGPPLGFVADYVYPLESGRLNVGDKLLLMTDGLCEAQDPQGDLFGAEQLWTLLRGPMGTIDGPALLDDLRQAARTHEAGQPPTDDLALLLVERLSD